MDTARISKRLLVVRIVAILDAFLLVPLLYRVITRVLTDSNPEVWQHTLGPIHGTGFLVLVGLTALGAYQRLWPSWYPAITVATFGPPGSLIGDIIISRRLRRG